MKLKYTLIALTCILSIQGLWASTESSSDSDLKGPKVNRTLSDYLASTDNPKLILGCGHNGTLDDPKYTLEQEMFVPTLGKRIAQCHAFKGT